MLKIFVFLAILNSLSAWCPPGEYSSQNQCFICPKGYYCSGDGVARNCGYGNYTIVEGSIICNQCPVGNSCFYKEKAPVKCKKGYFQNKTGRRSCIECRDGYFSLKEESKNCDICPVGHSCQHKYNAPVKCSRGNYQDKRAQTRCLPCEDGSYTTLSGSSKCRICPKGYSCSNKYEDPKICLSGYYQDKIGQKTCKQCPTGYYNAKLGAALCGICPAGHSCYQKNQLPLQCRQGTYAKVGSISCTSCPKDEYCPVECAVPLKRSTNNRLKSRIHQFTSFAVKSYSDYSSDISLIDNSTSKLHGYVEYQNNVIVVAFRGDNSVQQWAKNGPFKTIEDGCSGCEINERVAKSFYLIKSQMFEKINSLLKFNPGTRIAVTGHSFGGAIATIAAFHLAASGNSVDLITFGSPRIGNSIFKAHADNVLKGDNYRVTYGNDVVTVTPFRSYGYRHIGNEIHFTQPGEMYELARRKDIGHDRFSIYENGLEIYKDLL